MKSLKCTLLALMLCCVALCEAWATPIRVMQNTATPGGFVLNGWFFYCSMNDPAGTIKVWYTPESTLTSSNIESLLAQNYITYTPSAEDITGGTWSDFISAQELHVSDSGEIYLLWTQKYSATSPLPSNASDTCFYAVFDEGSGTFSEPRWYPITSSVNSRSYFTSDVGGSKNIARRRVRIDPHMFQDGANTYLFYVYMLNYNNITYAPFTSAGLGAPVELNLPQLSSFSYVIEAPTVFKRGSYYYLMYSQDSYNQQYHIRYRKATTLAGLSSATSSLLTVIPPKVTINGVTGVQWNMGHQHVFKDSSNTYRILYTYATSPNNTVFFGGTGSIRYDVYMDTLVFNADGTINTVPKP